MESNAKSQVKTGIFILFGIALALFSISMVGGDKYFRSFVPLYVEFDQVAGLSKGSVVSLSGLNIGNIDSIEFSESKNSLVVTMKIDSNYLPRIRQGSSVEVRTQGALGDKFLMILPGPVDAKTVEVGEYLSRAPATDFIGVLSEKGDQAGKVFAIIDDLHRITQSLTTDNQFAGMVGNLSAASNSLKELSSESRDLIKELRKNSSPKIQEAVAKMDRILEKIDKGEGTLGALINDPSLHDSIKSMMGSSDKKQSVRSLIRSSINESEKASKK